MAGKPGIQEEERIGSWMQTYSGVAFWPLDPREGEIRLIDIAHSLAMQCRYGGHTVNRYSVAEHCILLSYAVPAEFAREALMHDAAEAYLVDVPRPVKRFLSGYKEIEARLESVIARRFGLRYPWPEIVMEADNRILMDERDQALGPSPMPWNGEMELLGVALGFWDPYWAEHKFLARAAELRIA